MSMKTRKLKTVTAGLAVVVLVGYGLWRAARPAAEFFQWQMEATKTDIAPKVTGRIGEILVKEGDQIEPGALLLRIDSPEPRAKAAQAGAAGEAAQAVANKARIGPRPEECMACLGMLVLWRCTRPLPT